MSEGETSAAGQGAEADPGRLTVTHDDVARRAFEIWQARGGGDDSPDGDWYQAEQELLAETAGVRSQLPDTDAF
jgi:hypothetical protein